MHRTTIGRVRLIGLLEGISYVLLVFIAMPLKYGADMPQMVSVVGMAHGILFVLYILAIGLAMRKYRWPMTFGGLLVLGSLIPIGPFLLDGRLKRKQAALTDAQTAG